MKFRVPEVSIMFFVLVNKSQEEEIRSKIVGGVVAEKGRYPYQVSLTNRCQNICGGILIAPDYVLSAAHCKDHFYEVLIGRHDFSDRKEKFEIFHAIDITIHPEYSSFDKSNDIMLIKLNESSQHIPIKLDNNTKNLTEGADVTVIGWGTTFFSGDYSDELLEVEIDIVDRKKCQESYTFHNISEDMLCAAREGKDACQGDSGGPLIKKGSDASNDVLVGLVSWGFKCAHPTYPGVYANVSYFHDWIYFNMNSTVRKTGEKLTTIITQAVFLFKCICM